MFTTRPEILGTFGVVSSTHWVASAAGMAMLEAGGNAFDAAVATGMTLQICESRSSKIFPISCLTRCDLATLSVAPT